MTTQLQAVQLGDDALTVAWADGAMSRFHYFWLRDNCPRLRHATTNHRVIETSSLPAGARAVAASITADDALSIRWDFDDHESIFPAAWLRAYDYSNGARRVRPAPKLWDASIGDDLPRAHYPELLASAEIKRNFLTGMRDYGVGVLSGVPATPGTVLDVAKQFGEVRSTSWGTVFDVKVVPNANSVAYTSLPLVTHTDEAYRDPTPTVQLQHFLVADPNGGASTLVDGFKIAADLRAHAPAQFALLSRTMLHFHFQDASATLENDGPVIECDPDGRVRGIRYSNHSVQPFLLPFDDMQAYYDAYRRFGEMRESDRYQLRIKMQSGELYMVDNRRVLHGRTGFSSSGARHLQSCYIERDEMISRLNVLMR
jgi:gamma-butyrobetaine dioxygenase